MTHNESPNLNSKWVRWKLQDEDLRSQYRQQTWRWTEKLSSTYQKYISSSQPNIVITGSYTYYVHDCTKYIIYNTCISHHRHTAILNFWASKAMLAWRNVSLYFPIIVVRPNTQETARALCAHRFADDDEVGKKIGELQEARRCVSWHVRKSDVRLHLIGRREQQMRLHRVDRTSLHLTRCSHFEQPVVVCC